MSILISGDFHANEDNELSIITKKALIEKYKNKYTDIKYHIILGDAGFLWFENEINDLLNFKALAERPFPVLCVIGNHEPVLGIKNLPQLDIGIGEKVIVVNERNPFIAYLKRGAIYNIDGHKFLVLGGALSIDKNSRIPGIGWWENELWSEKEKEDVFKLLKTENAFDYVLSHTGPNRINETLNPLFRAGVLPYYYDETATLNERIDYAITCKQWFCGHWHRDKYYYCHNLKRSYQYLYRKTALMEEDEILVL